ncbi:MAG: PAS domain S-box protein, partial [Methanoregula sp.]|nr:PAS domain S-box protein [Methanoregula sp.]
MAPAIRLLYVDDEPTLLEIGKLFLEASGEFAVDTLISAREALVQISTEQYDTIISDYQMPEMDGITFLKQLKASGNTTPFIIFTGRGREEIVIEALNEGADFYLQKGGEPKSQFAELAHKIRQAVQQRRAVASIQDHERREADIIDFLPDATFAIDTQGVVIAWNRAMEKMTGVSSDRILGKGNYEYSIPLYHERRPILIDLILKEDTVTAGKYPAITRDGTTLFSEITIPHFNNGQGAALWFTASPLYNTQGTIIGAIESIREITERKQAEDALNESEKRFRELSDLLPQVVYETDTLGNLIYANHIAFELFGYSPEEFPQGLNVMQMLVPVDRERGAAAFHAIFEGKVKTGPAEEYQALRKDGSTFPISIYSSVVFVDGRITGLRGIIVDITEKKQQDHILKTQLNLGLALQSIRGLDETLGTCLDAAIGIAGMDSGGIYLVSGRDGSVDLVVSRNLGDEFLKSASHYPGGSTNAGIVMAGKPIYVQYHNTGTDHHTLWTQERLRAAAIIPIISNDRVISCLNISSHTVDEFPANARVALETIAIQIGAAIERIRADEALTGSEERYRSVVNDQTDLIARFSPDGIITFVNEAYRSYFTSLLDVHGIEGKDFREIMQVKDYREVEKFLVTLTRQTPIREMERVVTGRDGKKHWQIWSVRALFGREDEPCEYQVVGRDITKRREAEELLRQQTWNLKTINQLAIEFASLSRGDSVTALATKKLMELSGAAVTTFSVYNPAERTLHPTNLKIAPGNPDAMIPAQGKPPGDIKIPISTGLYREIVSNIVGTIKIPQGAGNDQVPPFFNPGIRKQMGIDHFMGIAYVIEGELYGTSVLAMRHGQPEPSTDLLESFAHIVAVSLRRDRAEATLHESEERLRSFIEQAHEGVSIVDDEGRIIEWNAAQEKITGISRTEALGACVWELATRMIPDEHRREEICSRMRESIQLTIKSGKSAYPDPVYYRFLRPDGTIAIAYQTVFIVKTSQGHMIGTLNQDVTEQRHADEKIKESEASYRGLFNTVRQAIYILDPGGTFIDVNEGAEAM